MDQLQTDIASLQGEVQQLKREVRRLSRRDTLGFGYSGILIPMLIGAGSLLAGIIVMGLLYEVARRWL